MSLRLTITWRMPYLPSLSSLFLRLLFQSFVQAAIRFLYQLIHLPTKLIAFFYWDANLFFTRVMGECLYNGFVLAVFIEPRHITNALLLYDSGATGPVRHSPLYARHDYYIYRDYCQLHPLHPPSFPLPRAIWKGYLKRGWGGVGHRVLLETSSNLCYFGPNSLILLCTPR